MRLDDSANARAWKSLLFLYARPEFKALLRAEIRDHERAAFRKGLLAAVRLNGTSDIELGAFGIDASLWPGVQFYDYTKSVSKALHNAETRRQRGLAYHLTYSRSEDSRDDDIDRILENGGNVAVVFRGNAPERWRGWPVVDGDEDDFRPWDPPGTIVALGVKGAVDDDTGFFV